MPGPITAAGALSNPTRYGALGMGGEQFTGLWTQRSPYRDAATQYLIKKFYQGSRFDSIWDGLNREITVSLTDKRRPGNSAYNSNTFDACTCFYSFKYIQNGVEIVRVMADTATAVYDATAGQKTLIFTKSSGAGKTRFLTIGATLYMANGVDTVKWINSSLIWVKTTTYLQGQYIVDSNNNLQLNIGGQTATITNIQISSGVATVFFKASTQLDIPVGTKLTFSGCTTVTALNGTSPAITGANNGQQVTFNITHADVAYSAETGSATTGTGITGSSAPTWATSLGAVTQDGGAQWECRGVSVQQWMYDAPTNAPTVTQATAPSIYPAWAANTWYGPLFVIVDSNGNLQQLTTAGTTASTHPTWATVKGNTTSETSPGTAVWTCLGAAAWATGTSYALGDVIQATFTYYITIGWVKGGDDEYYDEQEAVTATAMYKCTAGGTSGTTTPEWTNGLGTTVTESTGVQWTNVGAATNWMASATLSLATSVLDSNYNIQTVQVLGESGAAAPTWAATLGTFTTDNTTNWLNGGPYSKANTGAWVYGYSGLNAITGDITTMSPVSQPITVSADKLAVIQGEGVPTFFDEIIVWRTAQGYTAPLLYLDQIPNPGPTATWIYTDTTPDSGLIAQYLAPVAQSNNAPPVGMNGPVYHMQRVFSFVGNYVRWSGGPDTLAGNGNNAWPPLNNFGYTAMVLKLLPMTVQDGGLLVFTTSGVKIILGKGTQSDPFYTTQWCAKMNLASYDALDVLGTDICLMEANGKVAILKMQYPFDPQSGYTEIGLPIGDQFLKVTTGGISSALYNPATAFLSWNVSNTQETAMYVADGAVGWFRMSAISPPEQGLLWSPRAAILGGTSAVQSVETAPGVFNLLIGPKTSGPILMRDTTGTVWTDPVAGVATAYPAWDAKGVTQLCSTGQMTEVAHVSAKSAAVGARPTINVLLNEIAASATRPWNVLSKTSNDPPDSPASVSVFSDRYGLLQNGVNALGDCILTKFDYGSQAVGDELLEWGIFASTEEERKEMAQK